QFGADNVNPVAEPRLLSQAEGGAAENGTTSKAIKADGDGEGDGDDAPMDVSDDEAQQEKKLAARRQLLLLLSLVI
ncbi:hypothetical protein CTA2_3391, partial [Colletotrichum tanaceti]